MKVIAEGKIFSLKKNGSLTSYKWISPPHSQSNSNIPFSCALEKEKLLKLEDVLKKSVIGQDNAIVSVSNAIRRARAGLASE